MFERKIYQEMLKWKKEYAPKYSLFLKGARRVGKTTLAEKLGKEEYKSYILIRFDQVNEDIRDLFTNSLLDLDNLFNTLQVVYSTRLYKETDKDKKTTNLEVDFLIRNLNKIIPVEVKSEENKSVISL